MRKVVDSRCQRSPSARRFERVICLQDKHQKTRTLVEGRGELERADKLRVKTGGNFDTHAANKQVEVHGPQVGLLVPWHFVLLHHARDDGVGATAGVRCLEDAHGGGVDADRMVAVTSVNAWGSIQCL
jgi:hypothetical protein